MGDQVQAKREGFEAGFDKAMDLLGVAGALLPADRRQFVTKTRQAIEGRRDECADNYERALEETAARRSALKKGRSDA